MRQLYYMLVSLVVILTITVSCDDYDDSDIKSDIESLQERVTALETYCNTLNSQISSLQSLVTAIEGYNYVSGISSVTEDGEVVGYTISFSDGSSITIHNGTDGEDGEEGTTPVIGVTNIDGIYYWTLNGTVITDSDGNMIRASGVEGSIGNIPQLKIEDGYWYVSYDGGSSWTQLGEAVSSKVEYITGVSTDGDYVYITLYDGTVLTMAKAGKLEISFELSDVSIITAGQSVDIAYTISGADSQTVIDLLTQDDYTATLSVSDTASGVITIKAPEFFDSSEIYVIVSSSSATIMRIITITASGFIVITDDTVNVGMEADEITVPVTTNYGYEISVDVDWLSISETKSITTDSIKFSVAANTTLATRYATITITTTDSNAEETILVTQSGQAVNDNWSVTFYGTYESDNTKYNRIDYIDGDSSRYQTLVLDASYVESVSVDSLFSYGSSYLAQMVDYYDTLYGNGFFVNYACYTTDKSVLYSQSELDSDTQYYAFMCGVGSDGTLTGYYQVSSKFTPDDISSDAYLAWIGSWSYTDAEGTTGTFTISKNVAEESYYMYQGTGSSYLINLSFDSSDGSITVLSSLNIGTYTLMNTAYNACWYANITIDGVSTAYVAEGYGICKGSIDDDGTATFEALEVETDSGTGYAASMRYYFVGTSTTRTQTKYALVTLPVTLEK